MASVVVTVAFVALAFVLACGNPSGPHAGLRILAGGDLSDTIGAMLKPGLTVELLGADLQPVAGQTVYFESGGPVLVAPIGDPSFVINRLPVVTDGSGQAAVWVEFKTATGPGVVVITANGYSIRTHYTVLPGAAAHVRADPPDTALYVGGTVTYRPFVTDAHGNRRSDSPPFRYASLGTALTISSPGRASGAMIGRGAVAITALGFTDTAWVSVVPKGRLAAQYASLGAGGGYIVVTNLDGSAFDTIPGSWPGGRSLDWSLIDAALVLDFDHLLLIDIAGHAHRVITGPLLRREWYPRFTHDGSYVFFTGADSVTNCYGVWRVHPDGTGLEHVVADTSACGPYVYQQPPSPHYASSPSPDGTQVVYVGRTLRVRTIATGVDTSLGVIGDVPRWSPTGEWIAYDSLGTLMLIHPDGTNHRSLLYRGAFEYLPAVAWSPDGQWLVYRGNDRLILVNVVTGLRLPVVPMMGLADPTWQP